MGAGDPMYVDRDYQIIGLPPFLHGLNALRPSNGDADVQAPASDEEWFCFEVAEPVRVFLLYDSTILADHVPAWVASSFRDRHEETGLGDHAFGDPESHDRAGTGNEWEILSGRFPAGRVCLGGNGCTAEEDAAHDCAMYLAFVAPEATEEFQPGSGGASARYFDGASDYVLLPRMNGHAKSPKRAFEEITIDVWVKVYDFANPHPIMNEDNWDTGDMHFQFWPCDGNGGGYCSGQQGLLIHAINGNTMTSNRYGHTQTEYDYDFQVSTWYYISAQYSSKENFHKLYVNQRMEQTINDAGATTPVTLDSARIGSWMDNRDGNGGNIARSLHGEISVFRIWNIITDGQDVCPPAQTHGLIASYVFGDKADDRLIDLSGNEYDGDVHDAGFSDDLPPSQQCQRQGFGGFFDGDSDYVQMPQLRGTDGQPRTTLEKFTVDIWVKFLDLNGEHPIFMEDGWTPGAMHLQIYRGKFDLSINGMGDYIFGWQPRTDEWYFLQVAYQSGTQDGGQQLCGAWGCTPGSIFLSVDNRAAGDISSLGASCLQSQSSPDGGVTCTQPGRPGNLAVGGLNEDGTPVDGGKDCPCEINGPPVHLNSPRLGAWDYDADGEMDRSMRGQIAVFRLWDVIKNGEDRCVPMPHNHVVVQYLFDSFNDVLIDRSGNGNDAQLHDTKFSADYPNHQCVYNGARLASMTDPLVVGQHGTTTVGCSDCEGSGGEFGAHQPPSDICLNEAFMNPVIIAGVPTENGGDSAVIRIQNLRRMGEFAQAGINAGGVEYGNNCDGSDCGHSGRRCACQWCFDMFLQE